jgi:excisionase family DNA binding protein
VTGPDGEVVWLTTAEAARLLGISNRTVVRHAEAGHIPHTWIQFTPNHRQRRYQLDDILDYKDRIR